MIGIYVAIYLAIGFLAALYCHKVVNARTGAIFSRGDLVGCALSSLLAPFMVVGAFMALLEELDCHPFWTQPLIKRGKK